tara:strand:- start:84 stop:275 length:192 start_codon:yes stop_codon:yes gene_type:complete
MSLSTTTLPQPGYPRVSGGWWVTPETKSMGAILTIKSKRSLSWNNSQKEPNLTKQQQFFGMIH